MDLSQYLPGIQEELLKTRCFLAKGRLGIVNGSPDLEDFFQGITDYTAVIVNEDVKPEAAGPVKKIADYHLIIELPN